MYFVCMSTYIIIYSNVDRKNRARKNYNLGRREIVINIVYNVSIFLESWIDLFFFLSNWSAIDFSDKDKYFSTI